tara:strand:+ start:1430 stop:1750 length:321 start_codon:yes stop_codon:yes gene_type:complete
MYAIIRDRGKQYKVAQGEVVEIDYMDAVTEGSALQFEVLMTSDGEGAVKVGEPLVASASVSATIIKPLHKGEKIDVVHFRRRKDSMTKTGHRQKFTHVKIDAINAG